MKTMSSKQYVVGSMGILALSIFMPTSYFLLPTTTFAQTTTTEYRLLEPIPQLVKSGEKTDAATYLTGLFKLIIGIAGVLAVIMIIYGGVIKMSSDAVSGQSKANEIINNAIWGLLLAISAWLILYTVNPNLVKIGFNLKPLEIKKEEQWIPPPGAPGIPGVPMTPEEIAASNQIRKRLESGGVGVNAGPCTQGQGYGCTNLNGLDELAVQGLITLKKDCGCIVTVSGGTEPGPHRTHGVGKAIVDLRNEPTLRSWLTNKKYLTPGGNGAIVPLSGTGRKVIFSFEKAGQENSTADHWHLVFQ